MLVTMTVAGSDSIGGAGIQADIRAMSSLNTHPTSVITCVTSQNTMRVSEIFPLPLRVIQSQMDAVLSDAQVSAAKTGMLYSAEIATAVCERLAGEQFPIVVDPVMVAGVGDPLHAQNLLDALRIKVMPIATCVTPNRHEAEALIGRSIASVEDARRACEELVHMGAQSVLLKGGHFESERAIDILYHEGRFIELSTPRAVMRGHGGGCTLSSYIAALLAGGETLENAVSGAKERIWQAFSTGYRVGQGVGIVNAISPLEREAMRYPLVIMLGKAVSRLESVLPPEFVPEVGINFVFALPGAREPRDVCGLEGRIALVGGRPLHQGCISFGASRHMATVVLTAISHDGSIRSAANVRFSDDILKAFERAGMSIGVFDRSEEPSERRTMEWGTDHAIRRLGKIPDIIYDRGGVGKEPMIRVLGRDPESVMEKIEMAAHQW